MRGATKNIISEEGGLLSNLLGPLMKICLPLIKNKLAAVTKSVLIPLGLMAAASATDATIRKKMYGSEMNTLVISNTDVEDIVEIVNSIKVLVLLIKVSRKK